MQKACIIVPCYNESERLDVDVFTQFINNNSSVDFLFVNDGSIDDTLLVIKKIKDTFNQRVDVLNLINNSGKAEAVRLGVLKASERIEYQYFGYWDADLATPLSEIVNFLRQLENTTIKLAIGSRMKRLGANIERKTARHILGRVFSTFASIILKLPVYDTQCGAKLFHRDLVQFFNTKFITTWLFDIELLARYRNSVGLKSTLINVLEIPVNEWIEKDGSKLKLKHMLKVPIELIKIRNTYNA